MQDKHIDVLEQLKNESSLDRAYALMQKTFSEPVSGDVIEAMQRLWREKEGYLHYAMTHGEKDPEVEPKTTLPEELQSSIVEIRTAVFPEYDLNNPLGQNYNALLEIIKIDHPESFGEYQSALTPILKEIQIKVEKGDFASPKEAMVYALQNYFHHLQPTNPLKDPKTFIVNTAKYVGWAVISMAAGNVLVPVQKAGLALSIIQELHAFDYANLNPKESVDAICEQAAEITWMILSDQVVKKLPHAKSYLKKQIDTQLKPTPKSIAIERPSVIAHTPEGVHFEVLKQGNETSLLKNTAEKVKRNNNISYIAKQTSALVDASTAAFRAVNDATSIFVKNKHLNIGSGNFAKFNTTDITTVQNWVQKAIRSSNSQFILNPQIPDSFKVISDVGLKIGTRGETKIMAIIKNNKVVNTYPIK